MVDSPRRHGSSKKVNRDTVCVSVCVCVCSCVCACVCVCMPLPLSPSHFGKKNILQLQELHAHGRGVDLEQQQLIQGSNSGEKELKDGSDDGIRAADAHTHTRQQMSRARETAHFIIPCASALPSASWEIGQPSRSIPKKVTG